MGYSTYILYSEKLKKYYVGHARDIDKRLDEHNRGKSKFTKTGIPWLMKKVFYFDTKAGACKLELEIKKRGCKRFLQSLEK